jgi:hypothetical protein
METLTDNNVNITIEITEEKVFCEYGELEYSLDEKTVIVNSINVYLTRNKIGSRLVGELESRFNNLNFDNVEVPASPTKEAISFWKSLGYRPLSDDDKYWARKIIRSYKESSWDTPQGVVVMQKPLR